MTAWMQAATALAEALEAENAALRAMDVPAAVAHFPRKAEWTERLRQAWADPPPIAPVPLEAARECVARLEALARDNRRLLERAMFVQGRLIATLARAVPRPQTGYGGPARQAGYGMGPMALSARA